VRTYPPDVAIGAAASAVGETLTTHDGDGSTETRYRRPGAKPTMTTRSAPPPSAARPSPLGEAKSTAVVRSSTRPMPPRRPSP